MQMQMRTNLLYLLDANVLIDANRDYYAIERVPEFWDWILHFGKLDQVKVPQEVYDEVTDGDDNLSDWLKSNKDTMLLREDVDRGLVNHVLERGYASDLTDDEIENLRADPFLIAHALADIKHRCVVTNEVSKPSRQGVNRHIPDVCDDLQIRHCNTFELVKKLDFRTDWNQ